MLTCFNTPFGQYLWLRMPFGINSATEIWQRSMNQLVEGLEGIEVIHDNVGCGASGGWPRPEPESEIYVLTRIRLSWNWQRCHVSNIFWRETVSGWTQTRLKLSLNCQFQKTSTLCKDYLVLSTTSRSSCHTCYQYFSRSEISWTRTMNGVGYISMRRRSTRWRMPSQPHLFCSTTIWRSRCVSSAMHQTVV